MKKTKAQVAKARLLQRARDRQLQARDMIAQIEARGDIVGEFVKKAAYADLSGKTKDELKRISTRLTENNISKTVKVGIDMIRKESMEIELDTPIATFTRSEFDKSSTSKKLIKELNDFIKNARSKVSNNYSLDVHIQNLLMDLAPGKQFEAGKDYGAFIIDSSYKYGDSLYEHVKFKKFDLDATRRDMLLNIVENPYTTYEGYVLYKDDAKHRGYISNTSDFNIEDNVINVLETIMNSSQAWNIAKRNAYDSEQVKSNWSELYMKASEASEYNLLDEITQMIQNEESFDHIIRTIDNMIAQKLRE